MLWEESSRGKKKLMFSFLNEMETSSKFWKFSFKESMGVLLDQYASFMRPTQPSTSSTFHSPHPKSLFSHWLLSQVSYRAVCILGHRLQDSGQTGVTGTFPTQCHLDGEVLSV
jgi:hypothetical protein